MPELILSPDPTCFKLNLDSKMIFPQQTDVLASQHIGHDKNIFFFSKIMLMVKININIDLINIDGENRVSPIG